VSVADAFRVSPYFRGLFEPWLQRLGEAATPRTFASGDALADETASLYLLATGEVSASTPPDADGVSEIVGHEMPGSVFGSRLITGEEDVFVYRAVGPSEAYVWELPDLQCLLEEIDGLRRQLETRLSLRARRNELVDLLRRTPLFRQAGQSLVRRLVSAATLAWFEAGAVICKEGDTADEMFLIVSGEIAFLQDGAPEVLRRLHRSDFFGEIALVEQSTRTASAVASTDAEVLIVCREAFGTLYRRSSSFREAIRSTVELRLTSGAASEPDPELVWLVNETDWPTRSAAAVLVDALRAADVDVAEPRLLPTAGGLDDALRAARSERAAYVLCFCEQAVDERATREIADIAACAVHFAADPTAPFPYALPSLLRVLHVVPAHADRRSVRRDAFALNVPPHFYGAPLEALPVEAQRILVRLARAIGRRRVGVALGGGAAWGLGHVALLRGLERSGIPVDLVVGVSAGSLVGAFYASQGPAGLDRLIGAKLELSATALAAIGTTSSMDLFVRRHIPETRLEELSLPLAAVAVEAQTGREKAFRHGSLAAAIRASCSLPGVFGRPLFGGDRYLDACVRHNVPVVYCSDADADFVIACDVVPPPNASRPTRGGLSGLVLELFQINRLTDTVRSLYWLASTSGELQAGLADALFSPDLSEFSPWDFHRAEAIVEKADEQLDEWLVETRARYHAVAR
jgi:NTE family protein